MIDFGINTLLTMTNFFVALDSVYLTTDIRVDMPRRYEYNTTNALSSNDIKTCVS